MEEIIINVVHEERWCWVEKTELKFRQRIFRMEGIICKKVLRLWEMWKIKPM